MEYTVVSDKVKNTLKMRQAPSNTKVQATIERRKVALESRKQKTRQLSNVNTDNSTWFETPSGDGANITNVDPINTADVINASAIGKVSPQTANKAKAVGRQETPADYVGKVGETYSKLLTEPTLKSVAGYDMDRRRAKQTRPKRNV